MSFSRPIFTICIPCYNTKEFLDECLDSVAMQSFENWEIVLVDDGSNEETLNYLRTNVSKRPKVQIVYHEHNMGLYAARTDAIAASKGSYLMFLDSDDTLVGSEVLSTLYDHLQRRDPDILVFNMTDDLSSMRPSIDFASLGFPQDGLLDMHQVRKVFLSNYAINNLCNKVFKHELFEGESVAQEYMNMCEDRYRFSDALFRAQSIALFNRVLYYYRMNRSSISRQSFNNRSFFEQMYAEEHVRDLALQKGVDPQGQMTRILKLVAADLRASSLDENKTSVQFRELVDDITHQKLVTEAYATVGTSSLRPDEKVLIWGIMHHWPLPVVRGLASAAQTAKLIIQR